MFEAIDETKPIWYANRMLVVLRPNPPFVEWVNALAEPGEPLHDLDTLRSQPSSYLIPLFDYVDEAAAWVEEHFDLLLETELWQWSEDRGRWPGGRSFELFDAWFDVELLRAPWDVVSEPLTSEPPPAEGEWH